MSYKPYLGGQLTAQLLCRLSIYGRETLEFPWMDGNSPPSIDFWRILGVEDDFDRAYIVANIDRFCSLYNICGGNPNDSSISAAFSPISGEKSHPQTIAFDVRRETSDDTTMKVPKRLNKKQEKDASAAIRRSEEKAARAASRKHKRERKIEMRRQRAETKKLQREEAIKRVAQLMESAGAPDSAAAAVTESAPAFFAAGRQTQPFVPLAQFTKAQFTPLPTFAPALTVHAVPARSSRSAIVVSTAADLDQIVTYSNTLWAKYNAVAKEHNKRVKWTEVAKEMGINVKVREKYARMHARAKMRGFDFVNWGHSRIKDYPQYFLEPLEASPLLPSEDDEYVSKSEQKASAPAEGGGGGFSERLQENDQAIFNLAMEVADAGWYSSKPPLAHTMPIESCGIYGGPFCHYQYT